MRTILTKAMHQQQPDRWINIPADMKKHYEKLGWKTRELVDKVDAQQEARISARVAEAA